MYIDATLNLSRAQLMLHKKSHQLTALISEALCLLPEALRQFGIH